MDAVHFPPAPAWTRRDANEGTYIYRGWMIDGDLGNASPLPSTAERIGRSVSSRRFQRLIFCREDRPDRRRRRPKCARSPKIGTTGSHIQKVLILRWGWDRGHDRRLKNEMIRADLQPDFVVLSFGADESSAAILSVLGSGGHVIGRA